jgi:PKD repeat protein
VSICPSDASESNDWIISPQIQMNNNGSISFWVYSPKPGTWGTETYDVLVSTTDNQPSSFTAIATAEIAPTSWTQKTYSLSAYNNQQIYVAIRHRATDKFMFLIDDIELNAGTASAPTASFTYNPSNICQGSQVQFTNTSQNATSYSWSFPGGNPSTSTQTNPTVTFNTPGTYTITLTAYNGTLSNTYTHSITINPLPNISIAATPTNICSGSSSILTASGATNYQWSHSLGTNSTVTVYPSSSTTYTVTGTTNGCSATATSFINVFASPQAPTISIISNNPIILQSSATSGNQWYKDNNIIPGATNQTYQVVANGTYFVKLTSNGCTSASSNSILINTLSINDYNSDEITIYPNPAQDILYIQTNNTFVEALLYDNLGRLITSTNEHQLNLDNVTNGVYNLIIKLQDKVISLPVMIKK